MATVLSITGTPSYEHRKTRPALAVAVQTANGVFEERAPLYFEAQKGTLLLKQIY